MQPIRRLFKFTLSRSSAHLSTAAPRAERPAMIPGGAIIASCAVSSLPVIAGLLVGASVSVAQVRELLPATIAAPGTVVIMTAHAVGAQIYECAAGNLTWQLREPIATLQIDGRTVGRHFAGPSWELTDGSFVTGKVAGKAPGATGDDIPWLKLEGEAPRGQFADVTTIQRVNTKGGARSGTCDTVGELSAMPYAADYVFLRKVD